MEVTARFLEMLLAGASREDLDAVVTEAGAADCGPEQLAALRDQHALALRIHDQMAHQRSREAELSALNETARDLSEIRDLDQILTAIVRRARQLLHADMTYLSLNDEEDGASYMKVTEGALTPEFRDLRLPLGTGLLGLVAQLGEPYFTENYQADDRFVHRRYIDDAVAGEQIRAILGVPLSVGGKVIGALLAVHRRVRRFPPSEVSLLGAFAAHAAVALENARLFEEARSAVAAVDAANAELRTRHEATEQAARAHDRLTGVLLRGGEVAELAAVLSEALGGPLRVYDDEGRPLAGSDEQLPEGLLGAAGTAQETGRCVEAGPGTWVASAAGGEEHLGTLVLERAHPLELAEQRTLERGALVTALVLLFRRTEAEAERKVRGELLTDLIGGRVPDETLLRERARRDGADLEGELAVAVARPRGAFSESQAGRAAAALAAELRGLGTVHEGSVVVLAPLAPVELGARLADRFDDATIGVAGCAGDLGTVRAAWREAHEVLTALQRLGRSGQVSDAAGLGLARLLLGHNGGVELDEFVRATLGPLLEHDAQRHTSLVQTLAVWFDTGGALRETASRLHIHPNTVTQRFERVGRLLGEGWREPGRRLDLQVALQLHRLRSDPST